MISLGWCLALALGVPPNVHYNVAIESKTWQPLDLEDVERILTANVTAELGKDGMLRLTSKPFAELKNGDYLLLLQGRFIEEAEKFSVYLTFGPGTKVELPSFHLSATASFGHRSHTEMQKIVEELARDTGARLYALLRPRVTELAAGQVPAPVEAEALPWDWGAFEVPALKDPSTLLLRLVDVRRDDHERLNAIREIAPHAFDQPAARMALERCLLLDPSAEARGRCAQALEPVARIRTETQRLFLYAMRQELDANVLRIENGIAGAFVGLSRKETLETWLELVSSDRTPAEAADDIAELLAKEKSVPNLELAVARCLQQEALKWGKKHACAQWLLPNIPKERRRAVVWRYLETIGLSAAGDALTFDEITRNLWGSGGSELDATGAELLVSIASRSGATTVRKSALGLAQNNPQPTVAFVGKLLLLVRDAELSGWATRALARAASRSPEAKSAAQSGLKQLVADWRCTLCGSRGDPVKEARDAIMRLERER